MMQRAIKALLAAAAVLLLSGFGPGAPIRNVMQFPIPPGPAVNLENVQKAIMRAGITLGWQMVPRAPGHVEGVLNIRRHQAVIDITFDDKQFTIMYRTSTNLDYDEKARTIHSNYNGWIERLQKGIVAQVTVL